MNFSLATTLIPSLILIAGLIDDLKTRKVHNWLVLSAAFVAIVYTLVVGGWPGLQVGLMAMGAAIVITLPLVLARIMGAGDMKLMMAFALATDSTAVMWVVIYAFGWGALLGLVRVVLQGDIWSLLKNTAKIATFDKERSELKLHRIPFTVALLFGWLTHLTMTNSGGLL